MKFHFTINVEFQKKFISWCIHKLTSWDVHVHAHTHTRTHTQVGYATTNKCYNEQFISIKSACYNERGGLLSADVARACS